MNRVAVVIGIVLATAGCSTVKKLSWLRSGNFFPALSIADDIRPSELKVEKAERDTLRVTDAEGREMLIMRAVRDENGEMVATQRLDAAVVTASFKNVAERHGHVDLRFKVTVPFTMVDSRWQLRLQPRLSVLGRSEMLDMILITGEQYRKAQLRGYQQYAKFIDSIITDSTAFIQRRSLEVFLERNLPDIYALKTDTTYVSDEAFESLYGITERDAVRHYTDYLRLGINRNRFNRRANVFRRLVKVPIRVDGLRLDTVIRNCAGDLSYEYVQTIRTEPGLKKAGVLISGGIFESDQKIYSIPESDSLTFYISSLSSLVDPTEKYRMKVLERCVSDNSVCWISFGVGKSEVNPELGENTCEMSRISSNLEQLLENEVFDLDSIVVTASSSPEGSFEMNRRLSKLRSESVCRYYRNFVRQYRDSVRREEGVRMNLDGAQDFENQSVGIDFIPRHVPENWDMLDALVETDPEIDSLSRNSYRELVSLKDIDSREKRLSSLKCYRYMREKLYPRLRTVRFDFFLHRKGMVKDTIQTTELDTAYMNAVQMIRDRNYEGALSVLRPYRDFNTAVAYSALDYNESALDVLSGLPESDRAEYLKALLYSRKGDDQSAVQCYLNACNMNSIYIHRGNLDPEISLLIKKYEIDLN